jgi:hypothetical protein
MAFGFFSLFLSPYFPPTDYVKGSKDCHKQKKGTKKGGWVVQDVVVVTLELGLHDMHIPT